MTTSDEDFIISASCATLCRVSFHEGVINVARAQGTTSRMSHTPAVINQIAWLNMTSPNPCASRDKKPAIIAIKTPQATNRPYIPRAIGSTRARTIIHDQSPIAAEEATTKIFANA